MSKTAASSWPEGAERRVHFAGSAVALTAEDVASARLLDFLLGDTQAEGPAQPQAAYILSQEPESGLFQLGPGPDNPASPNDRSPGESFPPGSAGRAGVRLMDRVCFRLADCSAGGLLLHGALVRWRGEGLLLPAGSGSGKSTLAAELVRRGADYLSDELVYVPLGGNEAYGLRRALSFKSSAVAVLQGMLGALADREDVLFDRRAIFLQPRALNPQAQTLEKVAVGRIIFPAYQKGAAGEPQPLTPAQAGLRLMQSLINARNLPEHGFPAITELARQAPAVRVQYQNFDWMI